MGCWDYRDAARVYRKQLLKVGMEGGDYLGVSFNERQDPRSPRPADLAGTKSSGENSPTLHFSAKNFWRFLDGCA